MSWNETLLDASFRGVPLHVIDEKLQVAHSTSGHAAPYRKGETLEDLGRGARIFSVKVVLFGSNYEAELQRLLLALDETGPGELVHPIYGSVSVVTQSQAVQHSAERPDYCTLELVFAEHQPDAPFFERQLAFAELGALSSLDADTWQDGLLDLLGRIDSLVAEIQAWIGGGFVGLLEKTLRLPGIGLRLQQLRSQILGVVANMAGLAGSTHHVFDPLTELARSATEIRSAARGMTPSNARELLARSGVPASLPGGESLNAEAARAGSELLASVRQGLEPSSDALPDGMPGDPVAAAAWTLVVLVITELAAAHAEAVAVVIENEAEQPSLSPVELEALVNLARGLIQSAILLQRRLHAIEQSRPVIEALRTTAALIQARARQVILLSPPLLERTVEAPTSLRLLAFRWYGDHDRALELLRLNPTLKSPHNIPTGEVLRAYAQ